MVHKMGLIDINLSTQSAPESVVYDSNTATQLYSYTNTSFKPRQVFEGANVPYVHTDDHGYFITKTGTAYTFGTSYKVLNNGSATGAVQQWHVESTTVSTAGNCVTPDINLKFKNYARLYKYNGSSNPPYTTGSVQTYTPLLTCKYKMECWGANGQVMGGNDIKGKGGYTSGEINWSKDVPVYVYVGGKGVIFARNAANYPSKTADVDDYEVDGAWNGGGAVKNYACWDANNGTGGGATDIRTTKCTSDTDWSEFASLKTRIMVAGGGGGMVGGGNTPADAGGLESYKSRHYNSSSYDFQSDGATQTTGFKFGLGGSENHYVAADPENDIAREGGRDRSSGGGGYMGGNMQTFKDLTTRTDLCAASGGSSFISGHEGCVAILNTSSEDAEGSQTLNFRDDADAVAKSTHYSGKVFTNTVMIDGRGYPWTTVVGTSKQAMPNPQSGSNYTTGYGHLGNGFARITIMPYD